MKMPFPINYPEMVVKKSGGLTASENKLAILGYHTFLSLWSYPNPYKMQSNGKELCDLLIVFDKHIIIFQTKTVRMETPVMHLLIGEDGTKKQFKNLQNS